MTSVRDALSPTARHDSTGNGDVSRYARHFRRCSVRRRGRRMPPPPLGALPVPNSDRSGRTLRGGGLPSITSCRSHATSCDGSRESTDTPAGDLATRWRSHMVQETPQPTSPHALAAPLRATETRGPSTVYSTRCAPARCPTPIQWMRTDPSAHLPAHSTPPHSQRPSRPCTLRALFADGGALQPSTQALLRFPMGCACDGSLWGKSRAGRLVAPTASPGTSTLPPTHDAPLARAAPY